MLPMEGASQPNEAPTLGNRRSGTSAPASYRRRRSVVACQPCRRRKTKCDNVRPVCGFCQANSGLCVWPDTAQDYSSFDPPSITILQRINHAIFLLEGLHTGPASTFSNFQAPNTLIQGSLLVSSDQSHVPSDYSMGEPMPDDTPVPPPESDLLKALDAPEFCASITNCEGILKWPVFQGYVPAVESFVLQCDDPSTPERRGIPAPLSSGIQDDDVIPLSKRFLAYVHVKNPILDVAHFRSQVREVAENGPRWDGDSCLVLIACALACVALPFQRADPLGSTPESTVSTGSAFVDRETAESYYLAARKRLGLLKPSLLHIQCLFLCAVFEMYSMRVLDAWFYFNQASIQFQSLLWTRRQRGSLLHVSTEIRRLEQRLYWSCMKSEMELRCEIPLPPSGIMHVDYPDMLPSPPAELTSPARLRQASRDILNTGVEPEEERSWFYYLTEISFRRMMNRAVAVLGPYLLDDRHQNRPSDDKEMMKQFEPFQEQIAVWASHIPPQLRSASDHEAHSNELIHYVEQRELQFREWIHRPFVHFIIHHPPTDPLFSQFLPLANVCLELCIDRLLRLNPNHRHHGTWSVCRMAVTDSLLLLAAARSRNIRPPNQWKEALDVAMYALRRWSPEAPDLQWATLVLETVIHDTCGPDGPTEEI